MTAENQLLNVGQVFVCCVCSEGTLGLSLATSSWGANWYRAQHVQQVVPLLPLPASALPST